MGGYASELDLHKHGSLASTLDAGTGGFAQHREAALQQLRIGPCNPPQAVAIPSTSSLS